MDAFALRPIKRGKLDDYDIVAVVSEPEPDGGFLITGRGGRSVGMTHADEVFETPTLARTRRDELLGRERAGY